MSDAAAYLGMDAGSLSDSLTVWDLVDEVRRRTLKEQGVGEIQRPSVSFGDPEWPAGKAIRQRRERIATACLQGMLANPGVYDDDFDRAEYAESAREYADALIAELDKEPKCEN